VLHLAPHQENIWGEVGMIPCKFKPCTRWRLAVCFRHVTLWRGKQVQVLSRQEAVWVRQAVLKIKRKETSLSLAWNQTPTPRSTSHSLCHYSDWARELILYQGIKNFQNNSFKDYKILYDNNTVFSFTWITSANITRK